MKSLHRLMTVGMVFMLLFTGLVGTSFAQSEGDQTGADTQSGGGRAAPNNPDRPSEPAPDPTPKPQPQPSQPPASGDGDEGGSNSTGTSTQNGQQGPERQQPEPPSSGGNDDGGIGGGSCEFWILVDESDHMLYAFRGDTQVFEAINNVGQPGWETPTGTFYINSKYDSDDMVTYSNLPGVPWVMYFTNYGHAIHGTYWTAVNGRNVSHGCVNLSIGDALELYRATPIGTRVVIRY